MAWEGAPDERVTMPNFSHGTAGVVFALAALGLEADRPDLAERGREWTLRLPDEPEWTELG